jgi:hypothetical protein
MKKAVLTVQIFVENAWKISGHGSSMSTTWETIQQIEQIDLLMVFLHPSADGQAWMNDEHETVVTRDQLAAAQNLYGATVFVGSCYGLENDAMLTALEEAGAKVIIAGPGVNIGGLNGYLAGADVMAGALRSALEMGLPIGAAWKIARAIVHVAKWRGVSGAEDALDYRLRVLSEGAAKPKGTNKMAAIIAGIIGLLLMLFSALAPGGPHPTTFFSSILPPPDQVEAWDKTVKRNAVEVDLNNTIAVTDTDNLNVIDAVTVTEEITFILVDTYNPAELDHTTLLTSDGGVVSDPGIITWTVTNAMPGTLYEINRGFSVVSGTWTFGTITETLYAGTIGTVLVELYHGVDPVPTRTPTPTQTPTASLTPTPIPTRYVLTAIPFGTATLRPTVLCCQTTPDAELSYQSFLPIIMRPPSTPTLVPTVAPTATRTRTATPPATPTLAPP